MGHLSLCFLTREKVESFLKNSSALASIPEEGSRLQISVLSSGSLSPSGFSFFLFSFLPWCHNLRSHFCLSFPLHGYLIFPLPDGRVLCSPQKRHRRSADWPPAEGCHFFNVWEGYEVCLLFSGDGVYVFNSLWQYSSLLKRLCVSCVATPALSTAGM